VRLVIARCSVDYVGRLTAHLPEALRLLIVKADGSVLVHSDGGSYKPLNWMSPPCRLTEEPGRWSVTNKTGETLAITLTEVLSDTSVDLGVDPGLVKDGVEAHLQELLAVQLDRLGEGWRLVRREYPTPIGPVDLIGNGLVALAEHRDQRDRLLADPGLINTAIEEFLRYESPNQLGNRITNVPVKLDGVALPAGTQITVCIGAANRDAEQFLEPDTLDVGRSPNRHLAFASGIHQCAGMGVGRLEAATAIGRFLGRFPSYSLATAPTRGGRARFRGFLRVPCKL